MDAAFKSMGASAEKATRSLGHMHHQAGSLDKTLMTLQHSMALLAAAFIAKQVIDYADTWRLLEGRLKLVSGSTAELRQAQEKLFKVAQETRVSFENTVELYARLARSSAQMGLSQEQLVRVTELVNKTVQISGATAQEAGSAIIQLSQGFATGAVRGDEFRSVSEQLPGLLRAVAIGSDKTTEEIIKLGRAGQLTRDLLVTSILAAGKQIDEEFRRIPKTVGQAFTVLFNELMRTAGIINDATGGTQHLADAISDMANRLGQLREESTVTFGVLTSVFEGMVTVFMAAIAAFDLFVKTVDSLHLILPAAARELGSMAGSTRELAATLESTGDLMLLLGAKTLRDNAEAMERMASGIDSVSDSIGSLADTVESAAGHALVGAALGWMFGVPGVGAAAGALFAVERDVITSLFGPDPEERLAAISRRMLDIQERVERMGAIDIKILSKEQLTDLTDTAHTLKQSLDNVRIALSTLELPPEQLRPMLEMLDQWEIKLNKLAIAGDRHRAAQEELDKSVQKARESAAQQTAVLEKQIAVLNLLKAGVISNEEAQIRLEQITISSKTHEDAKSRRLAELKVRYKELEKAIDDGTKALEEHIKRVDEWAKTQDESAAAVITDTDAMLEENRIILDGIAARLSLEEIEHRLAVARIDRQIAAERARLAEDGLIEAEERGLAVKRQVLLANLDAAKATDVYKRSVEDARAKIEDAILTFGDLREAFSQGIQGVIQGTLDLGDFMKRQAQGIGLKFFEGLLFGKKSFDAALIGNMTGLVGPGGIIGGIFGQGGMLAASQFLGGFARAGGIGGIVGLLTGSPGAGVGAGLGSLASLIKLGALDLGSFIGVQIGAGISKALGVALPGAITGILGSVALPGLGALAGFIFETIFGGLFAHVPTKGTQIRTAVVDWLRDLDVVFAEEISRKKYGFEWTKDFMAQTGLSFLEASKQFIPENFPDIVAEDLVPKLRALGIVITSDMAKELDKSLEQTSVTFANMIAENLVDPEKISEFITDLIGKAEFSFAGMVDKINEAFEEGRVSQELYEEAILGTINLFLTDLPGSIDVAKIALESFTEDGIFSLEIFQEKMGEVVENVATIGEAAGAALSQSIAEGLTPEETREAFLEMIQSALREATVAEFIADFIDTLFEGIDLTMPLELDSEAIEILADRVQMGAQDLYDMLEALNLLPAALSAVSGEAQLTGEIIGEVFSQGIAEGMSSADVREAFLEMMREALMQKAIQDFIDDFLKTLDMSEPLEMDSEEMKKLADQVEKGYEWLVKWLEALGLMPEAVNKVSENLEKWEDKIYDAIKALDEFNSEFLKGADITTPLLEDTATLAEQMSTDVESAISQAISDALAAGDISLASDTLAQGIGTAIYNAIVNAVFNALITVPLMAALEPFLAQLALATQIFIDSGMTAVNEFLKAVEEIFAGILEVIPVYIDIINSEEWEEFLRQLGELTGAVLVQAPAPMPSGVVGAPPSTEQFNEEMNNAEDAIEQFIESLDDTTNALQDLIDAYLELLKTIEETPTGEPPPVEDPTEYLAGILMTLLPWLEVLHDAFIELGLDVELVNDVIFAITKALKEFEETGTISEQTLLLLQDALQSLLDAILANQNAIWNWLIAAGYWNGALEQIIFFLEEAIDTINKLLGETPEVPGLPDAQKAFIEEIQELVDEFIEAGEVTSDLSEEIEDLIDEYDTLKTTLIENEELIRETLELLGMSTELFDEWLVAIEESFIKQMEDLIDEIYEADSVWEDLHDTLITSITVAKTLKEALDEGIITQEQYEKFMKQVLIETIRAIGNELQELQETADDLVESFDDFIEAGQEVSDLQQQLNDLSDEYVQSVKDLRENFVLLALSGEDVGKIFTDLQESFIAQARAIGEAMKEELAGPAIEAIDEFNEKLAGTFDTFASLSDKAGAAIAQFQEAFEAGDMEGAIELAEDAVQAQIAFIEKIDELRVAFEEFIESLDEDIQSLIDEGLTLEEQIADREARIAGGFAALPMMDWEGQLVAVEDLRNAILEQFDLQKQLQQQILDDKIAEIEAARDARRELLQTDLDSFNERIQAHEDAEARITQIDEEMARLQIEIQQNELRAAIDLINYRIRVAEDAEQTRLQREEDAANELERIREETLDEQIRMAESFRDAAESIRAAIDDILLSEVSPLTPLERLAEAQRQFSELVGLARGGDVEAARALGGAAQTLLGEASTVFASSTPFQNIFRETIGTLEELGLQFEQDAQLHELQIISGTLEDIEGAILLTGGGNIDELIRMRDALQTELETLDKTPQEQLDELELERQDLVAGLEDNIDELRLTRDAIVDELKTIDEGTSTFDDQIREQTDAYDFIIKKLREDTVAELQLLKGYALGSKTALEAIERQALVDLNLTATNIETAIDTIVDEQIDEILKTINWPEWTAPELEMLWGVWEALYRLADNLVSHGTGSTIEILWGIRQTLFEIRDKLPSNFGFVGMQHGGFVPAGAVIPAILHGPEMIMPGSPGADSPELIREVRALREEVEMLRAEQGGTVQFRGKVVVGGREMGEFVTEKIEYHNSRVRGVPQGRL